MQKNSLLTSLVLRISLAAQSGSHCLGSSTHRRSMTFSSSNLCTMSNTSLLCYLRTCHQATRRRISSHIHSVTQNGEAYTAFFTLQIIGSLLCCLDGSCCRPHRVTACWDLHSSLSSAVLRKKVECRGHHSILRQVASLMRPSSDLMSATVV